MGTLSGKSAVVTGSTSGIGLAYARAFASAGANVVINGFGTPADIEKERSSVERDFKVKAVHSSADRAKSDEIAKMIALGEETFGRYTGQQCWHPVRLADRGVSAGEMGSYHRDQLVVGVLCHPRRRSWYEEARLGPHHQHCFGALDGGFSIQGGLCLRKARYCRPNQDRSP